MLRTLWFTVWLIAIKFGMITNVWRDVFLRIRHAPILRDGAPEFRNFWPYLYPQRLTQNDQIQHGNTYILGGQPERRRSRGLEVLTPWKYFDPLKMSHSFIKNCCLSKFHIIKDERLVSKMEGKTYSSRRAYRLPGTGIVECLEIITYRV